jgi:DNA polymerase-4
MFKALRACPEAVVIKPDFAKYKEASRRIMDKLRRLTPLIQPLSLDEAWLDLSGSERLNGGCPALVLARVQGEIEVETGLTVSVGLGPNKVLAKIASDLDKPRGFSVIGAVEAAAFLAPRPVTLLPGVGPAMEQALARAGLTTIGDLACADPVVLAARFGAYGLRLSDLAHGRDARPVDPDQDRKGVSAETTFEADLSRLEDLEDKLWMVCEKVGARLRAEGLCGRVATLKLKTGGFRIVTRRRTLPEPTQTARGLFAVARDMLRTELKGEGYRLIGVGLSDLAEADDAPSNLFGGEEVRARKTEKAVDALRAKFGREAVVSGRALKSAGPPRT